MKSKKSFFKLLNPLSLSFRDKTYEHDFLKYYKSNTVGHIRIAMIISVGLFLIFAWLDAYLFPEFKSYFYQIRFYFVIPVILFGIVYTLFSSSLKYLQEVTSLFTFLVVTSFTPNSSHTFLKSTPSRTFTLIGHCPASLLTGRH